MLTIEYIQNHTPIDFGRIQNRLNFFGRTLYELNNGNFYLRRDNHLLNDHEFHTPIQIFRFENELVAYFPNVNMQTMVEKVNMIHSETVNEFTGFEPGRRYELRNGQTWEQVGGVTSYCQPGGTVLIRDNNLMQIGNWNFEIRVRRIR